MNTSKTSNVTNNSINPQYARIWAVVQLVPAGKVSTYGQIADLAGLPGRARLVGKSLGNVPPSGFNDKPVPWYRIIRSSGEIAFPDGSEHFFEQRNRLIDEGVVIRGRRISLKDYLWTPDLSDLLFKLAF